MLRLAVAFTLALVLAPGASAKPSGGIAFLTAGGGETEIALATAGGRRLRTLTANRASDYKPAWSADGRRIAFVSGRDGNVEIYVMNADGSGQTHLTRKPGDDLLRPARARTRLAAGLAAVTSAGSSTLFPP